MTVGLVVGKFLPPHRGHRHLIDTALAQCDELHVCLLAASHEEPIIERWRRHAWLTELHPEALVTSTIADHRVDYGDPAAYDAWVATIRQTTGRERFDVLFTSEPAYGDETARRLGARHVLVDAARHAVPISATAIRTDPYAGWGFLEPCVRGYYARRVLITGAESTGTTTLAAALAERYETTWVPEYGREYSVPRDAAGHRWSSEEFVHIARMQQSREDQLARASNRVLFCDTDAAATAIWHERYLGFRSAELETIARERTYDLTFLADTDIPWTDDGTRNGPEVRLLMQRRFLSDLRDAGTSHVVLSGSLEERLAAAEAAIAERLNLTPPNP